MKLKLVKRLVIWFIIIPVIAFFSVVLIAYWKQDKIVQDLVSSFNEDFEGDLHVEDSHISPFENFPYISIDLTNVNFYDSKINHENPIIEIEDIYLGFNLWDLVTGNYDIKILELKNGYIHLIQDKTGELNLTKATASKKQIESVQEEFNVHLKKIKLINIDIFKLDQANELMVETYIEKADLSFKSNTEHILASVETHAEINIIKSGDTTFFKHKHLNFNTEIEYLKDDNFLIISPSELELENATFMCEGTIDIENDFDIDIKLHGKKKNFDLFIAMAPEELISTLELYENSGDIEFNVDIKGKSTKEFTPLIYANFSCKKAIISNIKSHKKIDQLNFSGYFTNNGEKGIENMEFSIQNFSAKPEAGNFSTNLLVKNFESPDIEMSLDADFDLKFLSSFINSTSFENLHGKIKMHMKFHDIIDLSSPEKTITKLNEAYYAEIIVENLGFKTSSYHLGLDDMNTKIIVEGNKAEIKYINAKVGNSDINISGEISDLPAIIHHSNKEVIVDLNLTSKFLDIEELTFTGDDSPPPIDEQIDNLSFKLKFISSAKKLTESPNLPVGEFFIENLYAGLKHYPHTLHDFSADFFIGDTNLNVVDFSGMIDKSDFHFNGKLFNYNCFLDEHSIGDIKVEFDFTSNLLKLEDLFSYKGENFVPEDYQHEEFSELKIHGNAVLLFEDGLTSSDLFFTQVDAKMKVHPLKFRNFKGKIHYQDDNLVLQDLSGKIGKSNFTINMNYYLGDEQKENVKKDFLILKAKRLDFDELFNYNAVPNSKVEQPSDHEDVFNIYNLDFPNMTFDIDIEYLNYHRYKIQNFKGKLRSTSDHYLYIDTLLMNIANGKMMMSGYFNGSDKDHIYFNPKLKLKNINLEKLLFKFENFGQDYVVSDNIQGEITSYIQGKIRVHADLTPIIDESDIKIDVKILNGELINYAPIIELSEYFVDKNVHNIRFDTLKNHIDFVNGIMTISAMTINSTLGYIIVSGTQDMKENMEYYIKIPLKLVAKKGYKRLFGTSKDESTTNEKDEIEYFDANKKTLFINLKILGNSDGYKVTLEKDK